MLTNIEVTTCKMKKYQSNMQKSGGKMRMVLSVGDNVGCSFQSSGLPNKETCTKISRSEMSRMWTHLLSLWAL